MSTAPRDGTPIIAKRVPSRLVRKHHEHVIRWDSTHAFRPVWRSLTSQALFRDEQFAGWRPIDDAGIALLELRRQQKDASQMARDAHRARRLRRFLAGR